MNWRGRTGACRETHLVFVTVLGVLVGMLRPRRCIRFRRSTHLQTKESCEHFCIH